MKTCTKCNDTKPVTDFYKRKDTKDGLTFECKKCTKQRVADYKKANPEKVAVSHRMADKKWRSNNKSKTDLRRKRWLKTNSERHKEAIRQWAAKNRAKRNAAAAKRRAAKLQATPAWASKSAIEAIYKVASQLSNDQEAYHVDHIVPLVSDKVCGLHCEQNLQVLRAEENLAKSNNLFYVS